MLMVLLDTTPVPQQLLMRMLAALAVQAADVNHPRSSRFSARAGVLFVCLSLPLLSALVDAHTHTHTHTPPLWAPVGDGCLRR